MTTTRRKQWIAALVCIAVVCLLALIGAGAFAMHNAMRHAFEAGRNVAATHSESLQTDSSTQSGSTQSGSTGGITLEEAERVALDHAGVKDSEATFVETKRDYDDGRLVYEIEFTVSSGSVHTEYSYDIAASDGSILSYDHDIEGHPVP